MSPRLCMVTGFALLALLSGGGISSAATRTWTGAVSNDWSDPRNWTTERVPSDHDTAVIESGTCVLDGSSTVSGVVLSGGSLSCRGLTVTRSMDLSGGTLSGRFRLLTTSTIVFTGPGPVVLDAVSATANGAIVWEGGEIHGRNGSVWTVGGTLEIRTNAPFIHAGGEASRLVIDGTLRKAEEPETVSLSDGWVLEQHGAVEVAQGTLRLARGTHHLEDGCRFVGPGVTALEGAHVIANGSVTAEGPVELRSGVLDGVSAWLGGGLRWLGGEVRGSLTVPADQRIALAGDGLKLLNRGILNNEGTVEWLSGRLTGSNGSVIRNLGVLEAHDGTALVQRSGAASYFINQGTFRKSATAGVTGFGAGFILNNSGTLEAQSGVIVLQGGGHTLTDGSRVVGQGLVRLDNAQARLQGTLTVEGGLELAEGSLTGDAPPEGAAALTGAGRMLWSGGELRGSLLLAAGSRLTLAGSGRRSLGRGQLTNHGTLVFMGGELAGSDGGMLDNRALLVLEGGGVLTHAWGDTSTLRNRGTLRKTQTADPIVFQGMSLVNEGTIDLVTGAIELESGEHSLMPNGRIVGAGALRILGARVEASGSQDVQGRLELASGVLDGEGLFSGTGFVWTGGEIQGTHQIAPDARLTLAGDGPRVLKGGTLTNEGTVLWTGAGALEGLGNALLHNLGLFETRASAVLGGDPETRGSFRNEGTLRLAAGTEQLTFTSSGLALTNAGTVEVQSGALVFTGGVHRLRPGTRLNGSVRIEEAAYLSVFAAEGPGPLTLVGGSLEGEGSLSVGRFEWRGGQILGRLALGAATETRVTGEEVKLVNGAALTNRGRMFWEAGEIQALNRARIENAGRLEVLHGGRMTGSPQAPPGFANSGSLHLPDQAETRFEDVPVANDGSLYLGPGALSAAAGFSQRAGLTILSGGRLSGGPFTLEGGVLQAVGTLEGDLENGGTLRLADAEGRPGVLDVRGSYTQTALGTLEVALPGEGPQSTQGFLRVEGSSRLDGSLRIRLQGQMPEPGARQPVLFHHSIEGGFEAVLADNQQVAARLTPYYTNEAAGVVLRPPQGPSLWLEVLARESLRPGAPQTQYVYYGNRGDADQYDAVLLVRVSGGVGVGIGGPLMPTLPPPPGLGLETPGFLKSDETLLPIYLHHLPAGHTGAVRLELTSEPTPGGAVSVSAALLTAAGSEPGESGTGESYYVRLLAQELAEAYARAADGIPGGPGPHGAADYWNQALRNGSLEGAFDPGPNPPPRALSQGGYLDVHAAGAWMAGLAGSPLAAGPAATAPILRSALLEWAARALAESSERVVSEHSQELWPPTTPNQQVGPRGVDDPRHLAGAEALRYVLYLEHAPLAPGPAQLVTITDHLDAGKLDLTTLSLGPITLGSRILVPPPGAQEYFTVLDLRPATEMLVSVEAVLDREARALTWRFSAVDPETGEPFEEPNVGFLNPNRVPPEGEITATFSVRPRAGQVTGTEVTNRVEAVFDFGEPLTLEDWSNTLDYDPPSSRVLGLPETSSSPFEVVWQSTDLGAGTERTSVYVSVDGGPYSLWRQGEAAGSGLFTGEVGRTYSFYSVAEDRVGNRETPPGDRQAGTRVTGSAALPGDANLDGRVDVRDALLALQASVGQRTLDPAQARAADIDGDGRVSVVDVLRILRQAVGIGT